MICIPLGKIAVPTPGTPVPVALTSAQRAMLPPSGQVHKIEIWPDPSDTGVSKILNTGVQVAALPTPGTTSGHAEPYRIGYQSNCLSPNGWSIDQSVANDGPFVTFW